MFIVFSNKIILFACFRFSNKKIDEDLLNKTKLYRRKFIKKPSAGGIAKNWYVLKKHKQELKQLSFNNLQLSDSINILYNTGNATFEDVIDAIDKIKSVVSELDLEIKIWEN